ncbi:transporter, LysE family protein [Pseudooceanicola batsensis HTCC2597]|uniref:Transporter, LysE family protein n=1 Tax=Pseudooceanicola batsensis (strain ATCC BAA-863 / DSM 15984 / KCTC 12145 / HTCC2597) TaxID=252305 RepID=A3TY24_PSEBH|nr:LysE family translocator [Pseudooceanicola batsensis]EAQ03058.1 transporter, LysE family protein [Pseudooceanicola batsensis HTCC2597]
MTYDILFALLTFCFVSTITPGPNNLMVMASGANFGYWRTMPHMLGIAVGFSVMTLLVGLGLIRVFVAFPITHTVLSVVSVAYLLWLAWKIARAAPPEARAEAAGRPLTFLQAALFQWVNPKAWTMALTAITVYAADQSLLAITVVAAMFALVCIPCVSVWTVLGQQMRRVLTNPARLRVFNWTMAGLLVASLVPLLFR